MTSHVAPLIHVHTTVDLLLFISYSHYHIVHVVYSVNQSYVNLVPALWDNYRPGAYQFSKINLRPFLRRFKTDFSGIYLYAR